MTAIRVMGVLLPCPLVELTQVKYNKHGNIYNGYCAGPLRGVRKETQGSPFTVVRPFTGCGVKATRGARFL
ncbi:hypothetical protein GCM10027091_19760 [Streptomyces daliensis]